MFMSVCVCGGVNTLFSSRVFCVVFFRSPLSLFFAAVVVVAPTVCDAATLPDEFIMNLLQNQKENKNKKN